MEIQWQGQGLDEIGIDIKTGKTVVRIDEKYFRPAEVQSLLGDASKAKTKLGWTPNYTFDMLVHEMCTTDH